MEYVNRIELQGKTASIPYDILFAGKIIGQSFYVILGDHPTPGGFKVDKDGRIRNKSGAAVYGLFSSRFESYEVKVLTYPQSPTEDFIFRPATPVRIIGRLVVEPDNKGTYIEATEVEYLNEKED